MNVRDKNLAIREIRALLVLLSKMITKELAQAGWCGCGCSPAWARDAGGTGCAFTVLPPYILEKGISHPRSRSWAAFAVAFSKKKKKSSLAPQQHRTSLILPPTYFGGSWPCPKTAGSAGLGVLLGAHAPCPEQIVGVQWPILMGE